MDEKRSHSNQRKFKQTYLPMISMGWELVLPIFLGVFFGYYLDRTLNAKLNFTLVLVVLGIFIGYYNLYRHIELEILRSKVKKHRLRNGEKST
jgi:predicted F0F1-ATPase subunit